MVSYMIGAGFYKEEGIMPGSNFIRGNILTNLSVVPVKNLTIDSRLYLAYTDRKPGIGFCRRGWRNRLRWTPRVLLP